MISDEAGFLSFTSSPTLCATMSTQKDKYMRKFNIYKGYFYKHMGLHCIPFHRFDRNYALIWNNFENIGFISLIVFIQYWHKGCCDMIFH